MSKNVVLRWRKDGVLTGTGQFEIRTRVDHAARRARLSVLARAVGKYTVSCLQHMQVIMRFL
jgi:hypothetical protein